MKLDNLDTRQNLLNRLRRIEGQVRGVQAMIESDRDCREILQQLTAIRSAVNGATMNFLQEYVSDCLLSPGSEEDSAQQRETIREVINLLSKTK
jgi:CsoR family transcriptional regulator, copper-sensing transcriptional repressor